MSSSFTILSGSVQEMLFTFLENLQLLHTGSIEFTVLREKGLPIGLEIHLQCLLAEKKQGKTVLVDLNDVETDPAKPKRTG